jgi:hypothetical protein
MKVDFLEPAFLEYQEAIEFYNTQSAGLGYKFADEIERTISIIKNYPESFPLYTLSTRKAVVSIFPFNIIYSLIKGRILVYAVTPQHRKPNYWLDRISP